MAGKRKGTEDNRHLWPEMLRAIRKIAPRWVIGENVYGLVNWDGGLVFEQVQIDLENEGYEVQPYILPACAKNAPHRRDRVWFIAHANKHNDSNGREQNGEQDKVQSECRAEIYSREPSGTIGLSGNVTNTSFKRSEGGEKSGSTKKIGQVNKQQSTRQNVVGGWQEFPTQPPVCSRDDGLSYKLDGITFPKWRNESIKAYGNAIVPQVAYELFKVINYIT